MPDDKRARLKQWLESGEATLHPLTFPQRELWEASAIPVGDPANHICCLIHVRGQLVQQQCETAIQRVVQRQEALRLSLLPGKERPLQMIRQTGEMNLQFRDVAPAQASPEGIEELAQEIFRAPFDLVQGPLYRAVALQRSPDELALVFTIHHAIADGWTLGVFVRELFGAYIAASMGDTGPLPVVPLSYTAWGAAERAFWQPAEIEARAGFWKTELTGAPRLWTSPTTPGSLSRWVSQLPAELSTGVRELARRSGATLFSTLLAGFQAALAQWTGKSDFVVGTPVANRNKQAVRETMGYCSGNVPIRCRVDPAQPFADGLRTLHQQTVDAFANAMPFAELVKAVGDPPAPGHNSIFDVRFALQNHPVPDVTLPNLSAKLRMRSTGTGRFDLGCEVTEQGETMEVAWLFRPGLFAQAKIEELHRLFHAILTKASRSPERRISALATV